MLYKIGEVAKLLGVSTDTVRYYEKRGIVSPKKDSENDYRYYDFWDVNFLIDCIWYRKFDFSIEQVADMFKTDDYQFISDMYLEKENEYREIIKRNELLLERSEHQRNEIARIEKHIGKCDIDFCPEHILFFNRYTEVFDKSPALQELAKEWLTYMPFTHRYFEISMEDLLNENSKDYRWGFELSLYYAEKLNVAIKEPLIRKTSRRCIRTIFKNVGKGNFSPNHLRYMVDYANENNLVITGPPSGILIASITEKGDYAGYFEAWLPIE